MLLWVHESAHGDAEERGGGASAGVLAAMSKRVREGFESQSNPKRSKLFIEDNVPPDELSKMLELHASTSTKIDGDNAPPNQLSKMEHHETTYANLVEDNALPDELSKMEFQESTNAKKRKKKHKVPNRQIIFLRTLKNQYRHEVAAKTSARF